MSGNDDRQSADTNKVATPQETPPPHQIGAGTGGPSDSENGTRAPESDPPSDQIGRSDDDLPFESRPEEGMGARQHPQAPPTGNDEALFFARLRRTQAEEDGKNTSKLRKHATWIGIGFLYLIAISAAIVFVVRILHLLLPEDRKWLPAEEIQRLDLFIAALLASTLVRRMSDRLSN